MDHFLLDPASVYKKSLNIQSVTNKDLPTYQPSQNPKYRSDSPRKEINKKLFAKADTLFDKSHPVFVSSSQIRRLQYWMVCKREVYCQMLLNNFAVKTQTFEIFTLLYFTLLDAAGISPTLVLNQNAKAKERRSWVPFKI